MAISAILSLALATPVWSVPAAGTLLDSFDASTTAGIPPCDPVDGCTGIAVDCWDNPGAIVLSDLDNTTLQRVRLAQPHDNLGAITITGLPDIAIGALAADARRRIVWGCVGHLGPDDTVGFKTVVPINLTTATRDPRFPIISIVNGGGCLDGTFYDIRSDTLVVGADVSGRVQFYNARTGALVDDVTFANCSGGNCNPPFFVNQDGSSCPFGKSGIARSGQVAYLGTNGCAEINTVTLNFTNPQPFAPFTPPDATTPRIEDLECDDTGFLNLGTTAIWAQDAFTRDIQAFATGLPISAGACACQFGCTCDNDCDDGNVCNGRETCNLSTGQCQNGTPPVEICDNGIDDNCNGLVDCDDPQCANSNACNIDHYKCYTALQGKTHCAGGATVTLDDQFGSMTTKLGCPSFFCTPVSKNGEGIRQSKEHLTCYKIPAGKKGGKTGGRSTQIDLLANTCHRNCSGGGRSGNRTIDILNQFGNQTVVISKAQVLCVPTLKVNVR